jgi:protein phosphatase PTC1
VVRLSYDHKGTVPQEQKRVVDAGGYISNGRINGNLAVGRSLGDLSLKKYVISNPYTSHTYLDGEDLILILACDGVMHNNM